MSLTYVKAANGTFSLKMADNQGHAITTAAGSITPGQMTDVTFTYNNTTGAGEIFIDGVSAATGTLHAGMGSNEHTHFADVLAASFDQFSFYHSVLTGQDVADLHANTPIAATVFERYDFSETAGATQTNGLNGNYINSFTSPTFGPSTTWQPFALPGGANVTSPTFAFVPTDNGTYRVKLTATDKDGATGTAVTSSITVNNVAPVGTVTGPTTANEGDALSYAVTVVDASEDTQSYLWSVKRNGVAYTLPGGTVVNNAGFGFTPANDGTYVVSVRVTDKDNAFSTATFTTAVANVAPVATIVGNPATGTEGSLISVSSTASDVGVNDVLTYAWTVTKDSLAYTPAGSPATNASTFAFTPTDNGVYVLTLTVSDGNGGTKVVAGSPILVANALPTGTITGESGSAINEGDTVNLLATGTDAGSDDVAGLTYAWTITKDNVLWTPPAGTVLNAAALSFVATDNGAYVATVAITDKDTGTGTVSSLAIVANNVSPTATIGGLDIAPVTYTATRPPTAAATTS